MFVHSELNAKSKELQINITENEELDGKYCWRLILFKEVL